MFEHMDKLVMPYLLRETNRARLDSLQGRTAFLFSYSPVRTVMVALNFYFNQLIETVSDSLAS